ncbi:Ras-related protein Rab-44 [Bienertia sinuspersici]
MEVVESMGFGHLKHLSGQAMNKELGKVEYGKACISIVEAKDYVLGEEVDMEKYRVAFLVVLLGMFVCPTTNFSCLASELTPALCAAEEANQYDWCSFVLDFLLRRVRAFSHSFDKAGYAVGCGGCTYFLSIFYLDRLRRPTVRWDLLKNVAEADRRNGGDFGKTKSFDVAYGEVHPRAARDIYPTESLTFAEEVANHIGVVISTEVGVAVDIVRRLIGEQNGRKEDGGLCISADDAITTHDANAKSSIPITKKIQVSSSTLPPNATITGMTVTPNVDGSSIPSTTNRIHPPKRAKPALNPTPQNPSNVDAMPSPPIIVASHPSTRAAVARSFALNHVDIKQFIFRWSSIERKQNAESENPILIKCFNCEASRRSCYGVLSLLGYVDSQYVATTAALNTRTWYKKYDSKCTRMMCDPSIAVRRFLLRL